MSGRMQNEQQHTSWTSEHRGEAVYYVNLDPSSVGPKAVAAAKIVFLHLYTCPNQYTSEQEAAPLWLSLCARG
jgi:hypothetical protein